MLAGRITKTATIAESASLSDAIDLDQGTAIAILMPGTWTSANLTFQASYDGTTYGNVYDDEGTEVTVTAAASRMIRLDPINWAGFRFLKVRSGTSGAAVNQAAARSIVVIVRSL